ncbi:hypothetical protein DOY81_013991 [Sarcophaga bullata]|nr:hypothetical protein DOY81_013991 [Sarcophaga bullata]
MNSKQSSDNPEDTEPRLWCFNKLEFLKPHLKKSALDIPPSDDGKDDKDKLWNEDTPELYEPVLESSHNERVRLYFTILIHRSIYDSKYVIILIYC